LWQIIVIATVVKKIEPKTGMNSSVTWLAQDSAKGGAWMWQNKTIDP
jgi:hypothetical protein